MCDCIQGFDGILFIGDLHLSSRTPGRRKDNYATAVLAKLEQSVTVAIERNLFPVFLGDIFHRPDENELPLLAAVAAQMRRFSRPPVVVGGSHDRKQSWFSDQDALKFVSGDGRDLSIFDTPGLACALQVGDQRVELWVAPAGAAIPDQVPTTPGAVGILVTHHDFDFGGKYPDAHELKEVGGVQLLVNGHMHTPAPMTMKGRTACHNPGSVGRPSVDLKNHQPKVSAWTPAHGLSLEGIPLMHATDVFDLTGKEVFAATTAELKASLPKGLRLSSFAARLRDTDAMEAGRTDDGSVMVEELANYCELFDKPLVLRAYLGDLLQKTLSDSK